MTRRELWAWTVLVALASQILIVWLLVGLDLPVDQARLGELRFAVVVGSGVALLGVAGWAREASRRPK